MSDTINTGREVKVIICTKDKTYEEGMKGSWKHPDAKLFMSFKFSNIFLCPHCDYMWRTTQSQTMVNK